MTLEKEWLDILCCPKCKGNFTLEIEDSLTCLACQLVYPIRNGIPILLIDEAKPVTASRNA